MKKLIITILILTGCLLIFPISSLAQDQGPPFPRIGVFHFGGYQPEWYAKFGLVMTPNNSPYFADAIHNMNSDAIVLVTRDWNVYEYTNRRTMDKVPDNGDWFVKDSKGNTVRVYSDEDPLLDITDNCPQVKGQRYNEYLPEYVSKIADLSAFDGVMSQGLWPYPYGTKDVDLDKDGENDWKQHGKGWLRTIWSRGATKAIARLRNLIKNKIIMINSGIFHRFAWSYANGIMKEHSVKTYNVKWELNKFYNWRKSAPRPQLFFVQANGDSKDNFAWMRYFLGRALMYDAYYSYSDFASGEHHYNHYYDEFDLDLGYPKGDVKQVKVGQGAAETNDEQGIWAKFYDKGAMIINLDHKENTLTDAELQQLKGYEGPYYRFKGGQDPDFNNGKKFREVKLRGILRDKDPIGFVGDAIILVKEPTTVVADIIIDNIDGGTSPASKPAKLEGDWTNMPKSRSEAKKNAWGVGARPYANLYNYATAQSNSGAKATFTPTMGIQGKYEVFEWHGWLGSRKESKQEATNVPVTIKHANGEVTKYIDQSKNEAQWNSLGTYYFNKGTDGKVIISNQNTDGPVIADAIKFVFEGTLPYKVDFNCDDEINIQDFAILLSHWGKNKKDLSGYQHPQCKELESKRALKLSNNSTLLGVYDLDVFLSCWDDPQKQDCYLIE